MPARFDKKEKKKKEAENRKIKWKIREIKEKEMS